MHNYTRDDIFHIVEEEDVAFIRLQFTDIFGTMKNMAVTVGQLEKALDNRCMFDVSSLEGVADEEESDMYLYPDLSTFEIFPWRPQQGKQAIVSISDDGNGIADEIKPRIFDMFYSGANQIADSRRSLGLGLSLCKSIINAHGGELTVSDNLPHGTVFTFTLPAGEVKVYE